MSSGIYAELEALCVRNEFGRAQAVLERETLSQIAVFALLHQAIAAEHAVGSRRTNRSLDGRTLLHVAAAKRNLAIVRLLLDAGATLTAADRKGIRVADTVTWTEIVYPAVACPLQNAVFKLGQRNDALEDDTRVTSEAADKTMYAADVVQAENESALDELAASRRLKQRLLSEIKDTQRAVEDANVRIVAHGPQSELVDAEIRKARETTSTMVEQVHAIKTETVRLANQSERLRRRHAEQLAQLTVAGKQCAVKCEAVDTVDRFASDEAIQQRFLRALVTMCDRVDAVRKLAMGGIQARVLNAITRHSHNAQVVCDAIHVILQLMDMARKHPEDEMLTTYLTPWPTEALLRSLEDALQNQTRDDDAAVVLSVFLSLLQRLPNAFAQTDLRSAHDLKVLVQVAAARILAHGRYLHLDLSLGIRSSIQRLAS